MLKRTVALALAAAWLSAACVSAQRPRLNDAQIAHITTVVHGDEVEQAWLATDRATHEAVKTYAAHMIQQHSASKREQAALAEREQLEPAPSGTAQKLAADSQRTLDKMRLADPKSFDAVYMDAQIRQHEALADLLDDHLIPQAVDPELRARLLDARQMVARHLADAREVRAGLARAEALEPHPVWTTTKPAR